MRRAALVFRRIPIPASGTHARSAGFKNVRGREPQMKTNTTKTALFILLGLTGATMVSGCALAAGAAVGAAAVDYFSDDNDECNGPNDEGLLDSDCND
jgi:hypothetical protein